MSPHDPFDPWGHKRKRLYWPPGDTWVPPPRPKPEPVYIQEDKWPHPKPRTDLVFAKSCAPGNWCNTDAGTTVEPASNFGNVMIAGAMLLPSASTAIAAALDANLGLGRMAGGGIMQQRSTWMIRGLGGMASVFILGMLPEKMGDGTFYTDDQLRTMSHAPTRVRFQFRQDQDGVLQVYGIHTKPSGDDSVRTVQATWNADKTAMEAKLNGFTLLWTPRDGRFGSIEPLTYPDNSGVQPGTILVHPIPENIDSEIEGYPGENITTDDCIVVFPAGLGWKSMYVMYSRPFGGDHSYHPAPKALTAFPEAVRTRQKGERRRWESKRRIYEWDYQHGAVEVYDKLGNHLGEFDAETGEQTGQAKPERRITTK
ncbi:MAG TPA: S-type pyocin domain-containing protein [Pseudomonas sp.]|jgi:hypothetical protein